MGTVANINQPSAAALPPGPTESRAAQGLKMGMGIFGYLQDSTEKYGPAFTIQPPGLDPMVWVSDIDMVKDFFSLKPEQYDQSKVPIPIDFGRDAIGFINDQYHADTRKVILKPLNNKNVADRADVMLELVTRGINNLEVGKEYDFTRLVGSITLDIATYTLLGDIEGERFERYRTLVLDWMYESCKDSMFFIGTMYGPEKFRNWLSKKYQAKSQKGDFGTLKKGLLPWSYAVELKATLADMIRKDIRELRAKNDMERDDVLTRMVFATYSDGTKLSEEKILTEVLALFIAGYETSAATGGWFSIWLQKNPHINNKIREEVLESIKKDGRVNPHTLADNKYISACLNESQRLTPSAVGTMRHIKQDTKIGSVTLPAGTNVLANAYIAHRNKDVWGPDALEYRPERWLAEDCRPKPYEFFPFGGGRRACMGSGQARQQLRILFSELARRVEFTSKFDNNDKWPGQQQAGGQTVPQGGVPMRVKSVKPF